MMNDNMRSVVFSIWIAFVFLFSAGGVARSQDVPPGPVATGEAPSEGPVVQPGPGIHVETVPMAPGLQGSADSTPQHKPREILVKFLPGTTEEEKAAIRESLGAEKVKAIRSIGVEHWRLPEELTTEEALGLLEGEPAVDYAEPNYLRQPQAVPNDSLFGQQWHLQNLGQQVNNSSGTPGADISAVDAWDLQTGSPDIVIAVIDSGVAMDHPDLNANIWTNDDEIPGNGLDDDENGYTDDVHGWDFANDDSDPSDYSSGVGGNGHGTHVAGTIAAVGNNGLGVSGVMWRAQIMPLQVGHFPLRTLDAAAVLGAFDYAVSNGARILNCSFSGSMFSQSEYDLLAYADQQGVLVIAAAGNESLNNDITPGYPASYDLPNIIAVAATDQNDNLASYSNYGPTSVDLAAPGGSGTVANLYSTLPPERTVLFAEDFSIGSRWHIGFLHNPWAIGWDPLYQSSVLTDSYGTNYADNEFSWARTDSAVDVRNHRGILIEYRYDHSLQYYYDFAFLELSEDGGASYEPIVLHTGDTNGIYTSRVWSTKDFDQAPFHLGFGLVSDGTVTYDGIYVDDLVVSGIPWVFDGSEYGFKSGTSMAAPVTAGVAGLVWSANPSLTHLEVKEILLNTVDPLSSLAGKVATGGRVNAYQALLATLGGGPFNDVPPSHWARDYIEALFAAGITKGCAEGLFCPEDLVTRAQMAAFLERGIRGPTYEPPPASGLFGDVPPSHWASGWIEQLYADGITKGCSTTPLLYCPESPVTRAEMAVFLMRTIKGADYTPPAPTGLFADVPAGYWAAGWIEALYHEGITTGCGTSPLRYCPEDSVTRAQMAAFLVRAFGL